MSGRAPAGAVAAPARWVLPVTATAALLVTLDALVVSTALDALRRDLHASVEQLEWTVTGYLVAFAALLMTASALGDRYGRRRVFSLGLALFALASAGCALSPDVGWLIAARVVQGTGAALVMPLGLALLAASVPAERRARALGAFTGVVGLAVPAGPLLGGAVVQGLSWPWIFWINPPVAVALLFLARVGVPESHGPSRRLDLAGTLLITVGSLLLIWALVRGGTDGWTSARTLVVAVLGLATLIGFVLAEHRSPAPMLPMSLFGSRTFSAAVVGILLLWGSVLGTIFFTAQYLQIVLGLGPLASGAALLPWGAVTFAVPPLVGRLMERRGPRPFAVAGTLLNGAALGGLALAVHADVGYPGLAPTLALSGIGVAAGIVATQAAALGAVTPQQLGVASGVYSTLRQFGGAIGVAVAVAAFGAAGSYRTVASFTSGYVAAATACAAFSLLAAAVLMFSTADRATRRGSAPRPAAARPAAVRELG